MRQSDQYQTPSFGRMTGMSAPLAALTPPAERLGMTNSLISARISLQRRIPIPILHNLPQILSKKRKRAPSNLVLLNMPAFMRQHACIGHPATQEDPMTCGEPAGALAEKAVRLGCGTQRGVCRLRKVVELEHPDALRLAHAGMVGEGELVWRKRAAVGERLLFEAVDPGRGGGEQGREVRGQVHVRRRAQTRGLVDMMGCV